MPKLQLSNLPPALEAHFLDRIGRRLVTLQDLLTLATWIKSDPTVPDGPWYKDFGSFKLAGSGSHLKTILEPHMHAHGVKVKI